MPAEIVVAEDCASNYGIFLVTSSRGDRKYSVSLSGSEGPARCDCQSFKYSPEKNKTCKHVEFVVKNACLYNSQWHDSSENPRIVPVGYNYDAFTGSTCACGGPMVAVRRAV